MTNEAEQTDLRVTRWIDRAGWPAGPWDVEPDRIQWKTEAGFPALIVRNGGIGNLCGYVGVPRSHSAHGKPYDDVSVDVHGGLTYAEKCAGRVCHVPNPGEPDDVWWLGFDCAHGGDSCPGMMRHGHMSYGSYKNVAYVRGEAESLARQLARMT